MHGGSATGVVLGVLPTQDLEGTREDLGYFARGFLEDLTIHLSRFANLTVIDSHSAFSDQLRGLSDDKIAEKLRAHFLLKTKIRKYRDGVRFSAQLIDPSLGSVLWADRFDVAVEKLSEILDITEEQVASALSKHIDIARLQVARKKDFSNLAAYDCWLRGYHRLRDGSIAADAEARTFFQRALEIDPYYARAYVGLSLSHFNDWSCQAADLAEASECFSYQYAREAIRLDDQDHVAHFVLGRVLLFRREFERAETHIDRSLSLNRNDADTLVQISFCRSLLGDPKSGMEIFNRAIDLNPLHEPWYFAYGAFNRLLLRDYEGHLEMARRCDIRDVWVDLSAMMAIALAYLDQAAEARRHLETFRAVVREKISADMAADDEEVICWLTTVNPFRDPDAEAHFVNGLREAGLGNSSSTVSTPLTPELSDYEFRLIDGQRRMSFAGATAALAEVKGFADIEKILAKPNEEIHCSDLMGVVSSRGETDSIDERARRAYRERICELQTDLEEAERANDPGRTAKIREELDTLLDHLAKASGLGGRSRKLNDPAERARSAVTWRIRSALKKIQVVHPPLAKHLENSIRTGLFCSYSPEKPVSWSF